MAYAGGIGLDTTELPIGTGQDIEDTQEFLGAIQSRKRTGRDINLSTEQSTKLAQTVIQDFNSGATNSKTFLDAHVQYMRNWRGVPEDKTNHPWGELAANVKVPITSNFIEQWMARISKIVLDNQPMAPVKSLNLAIQNDLRDVSDWFDWELRNIVGVEDAIDDILHYVFIDGMALPTPMYHKIYKRVFESREFEFDIARPVKPQIEQAIQLLFQDENIEGFEEGKQLGTYFVQILHEKNPAQVRALIDNGMLVLEVERERCVFDGVKIENPSIAEDAVVLNSDPDIEKLPFFGVRCWFSAGEVQDKAKKGGEFSRVSAEDLETVIASKGPKQPHFVENRLTKEHDEIEGRDSTTDNLSHDKDDNREWIEVYRWESEINYKDERIPVIAWVAVASGILLKVSRLEEVNPEGCRTPVKIEFIRVPGRFYSIGLAEWLRHTQTEIDGIHNFRLDCALIATSPFGFYEPNSGNSKEILKITPGEIRPIRSVKGLLFPNLGWNPIWGFQEEGLSRKYGSELAGIGDPGAGSFSSKRVSASEFSGTLAAIDVRTEYIARRILGGLRKLFERIFILYQKHAATGRIYQVAGENGEMLVKRLDITKLFGKMQITLNGTMQQLSSQIERETSMMMFQLLNNPLLVGMGIVKPDTIYEGLKKVMKAAQYAGVPLHKPDVGEDSPPPNVEHQGFMVGLPADPHMGENFAEHLQAHLKLASDPNLDKLLPGAQAKQLLAQHIAMTSQMQQEVAAIRQLQMAQAAAMGGQMQQFGMNQPGAGARPGSQEEGVQGGPSEANSNGAGYQ